MLSNAWWFLAGKVAFQVAADLSPSGTGTGREEIGLQRFVPEH
jgi:hypothetical protein